MTALDGKVTYVSGSGGGQGRAVALLFAARGARVVGCDVDGARAEETLALVRDAGGDMVSLALDVSTPDGAAAWIAAGVEAFGAVDVLYNNASGAQFGTPAEVTPEAWALSHRHEIDVAWFPVAAAWPHLAVGGGAIVNVASVAAIRGAAFLAQVPHGTAKGAVLAMTYHLAACGGPFGIRANAILPGLIATPAVAAMLAEPDGVGSRMVAANPLGRAGEPEDVARLAAFLASDDAAYVNGAAIPIDGGQHVVLGPW